MKLGTRNHPCVGKRIEIPAYCDLWMRGARIGTVERVIEGKGNYLDPRDPRGATIFVTRMDHPQVKRLVRVIADDCKLIGMTDEQIADYQFEQGIIFTD